MTVREAMIIALERVGVPDIQSRLDWADLNLPEGRRYSDHVIPRENEEAYIQKVVNAYREILSNPKVKAQLMAHLQEKEQRRDRNQ